MSKNIYRTVGNCKAKRFKKKLRQNMDYYNNVL